MNFTFNPLDYDNYEYDQDGNLDMTKTPLNENRVDKKFPRKTQKTDKFQNTRMPNAQPKKKTQPQPKQQQHQTNRNSPKKTESSSKKVVTPITDETVYDDYQQTIELSKIVPNSTENVQEKSSDQNSEYIYEYLDVEDLLKILNQSVRNKTSSNEPKVEAEYYDEDFYYYDDSKATNTKNDNDKIKTDKKLSVESDYQYQGSLYFKNRFWCFRYIRFHPVQV